MKTYQGTGGIRRLSLNMRTTFIGAAFLATLAAPVYAQVTATQVAGFGIPPGQVDAPDQPSGLTIFGSIAMVCDSFNGCRDYVDATCNATPFQACAVDPRTSTQLVPDTTFFAVQIGGHRGNPNADCGPGCMAGQPSALDPNGRQFFTFYDKGNGGVLHQTAAGLYTGFFPGGAAPVGSRLGLGGNRPAAVTIETVGTQGPNGPTGGTVLLVNLNNPNIVRVHCAYALDGDPCQSAETVGGNPAGAKSRGIVLVGPDAYTATEHGLARIRNVTSCSNNQNGCGNAVAVDDGLLGQVHTGIASDGGDNLYLTVGTSVYRYSISTGGPATQLSSGYSFCPSVPNMIVVVGSDLYWGDDTSCGAQVGTGRLWRASLASLP